MEAKRPNWTSKYAFIITAIGSAVGHFLNKPVGDMVSHGARKIVSYARQAWKWATNAAVGVLEKAVNWLFS